MNDSQIRVGRQNGWIVLSLNRHRTDNEATTIVIRGKTFGPGISHRTLKIRFRKLNKLAHAFGRTSDS
jgi:hypothetical protein